MCNTPKMGSMRHKFSKLTFSLYTPQRERRGGCQNKINNLQLVYVEVHTMFRDDKILFPSLCIHNDMVCVIGW